MFCTLNSLYAQLLLYVLSLFLSSTLDLLSVLILDQNINEIVLTEKRKKKKESLLPSRLNGEPVGLNR